MLTSPAVRIAAMATAFCLSIACAQAQSAASSNQASTPAAQANPPMENSSPQLTVRTNGTRINTVSPQSKDQPDAQKYIEREFGPGFKLAPNMPVLLGDLDGDGREDAVFIVTGGNPMMSAGAFGYSVLDPYDGYWSFSNPSLNAHMTLTDPGPHYLVLVAHDWKGEKPKAKFVFINLPFTQISLTPTTLPSGLLKRKSKKVVAAIATVENDGQTGAVFWTGHTYKFVQLGNVDE